MATPACAPQPAEMAAWWPFDELDGTMAWEAIGGHHGVVQGDAAVANTAKVGPGRIFDGTTGMVVVPSAPALNAGRDAFSIDAWINPTSDALQPIVTMQYAPADAPLGYALYVDNRHLGFAMSNEGSSIASTAPALLAMDGQWHLVAVTIERGSTTGGRLYIDGALVHTFDTTPLVAPVDTLANLLIAAQPALGRGLAPRYFKGGIDEVEIFHRALSHQEILAIYDAATAGKCDKPQPSSTPTM